MAHPIRPTALSDVDGSCVPVESTWTSSRVRLFAATVAGVVRAVIALTAGGSASANGRCARRG